eukprot:TRINITY_DN50661_c0_g1_i1.p1 TRINITY_DN50661_c0_g1~~TRINITY_DN50661_c0_g1_i1.p1  ORF type:complete len:256 (-),score=27.78 TRINITY_DN50661_c0_g1_i1:232-945(-)
MSKSTCVRVPACVVEYWEGLLADDSAKDVELICQDGSVWAHSLLLRSMSQVLQRMLDSGMVEGRTRKVSMPSFLTAQVQLVIRFVCTGHIHPDELPRLVVKEEAADSDDLPADSDDVPEPARLGLGQRSSKPAPPQVPWNILSGAMAFAKQYDMQGLLQVLLKRATERVSEISFDDVMLSAIKLDISPLKMACLKFAEKSSVIRGKFYEKRLSDPVLFELCAIWPDAPRKTKRIRLA